MPDICDVILAEHGYFRRAFSDLYGARDAGPEALTSRWQPLAAVFERHAAAEEEIFYPALLPRAEEGVEETEDAIKDHNAIRDAVRDAEQHDVGSDAWWQAVGRARSENDEHMEEEEKEGLPDFTAHSEASFRQELGARFLAFNAAHPCAEGLDLSDKDPDEYIRAHSGG
ncbi:MAG TPA: hemerythrin domain-containing protein [Acidimicrobiia bacterium]|nr:hemerythrin domain-containing protein [Acidimicrobiia bacterium]